MNKLENYIALAQQADKISLSDNETIKAGELPEIVMNENFEGTTVSGIAKLYEEALGDNLERDLEDAYRDSAVYFADNDYGLEVFADSNGHGSFTLECIGDLYGNKIYADTRGQIDDEFNLSVFCADGDKGYINVDGEKVYFDLPQDIIEKLEKTTEKLAYREFCEGQHEQLYEEYKQSFEDGFELEDELREYDDWLNNLYPDEGYFFYHVPPELAKVLIEYDELLDLDYIGLYEKDINVLFSIEPEDLVSIKGSDDSLILRYEYEATGDFWKDKGMDKLLARSDRPDLFEEMCNDYGVEADTYEEFAEYMAENKYISDYIGFEIDLSGKELEATAFVDISLPNEIHSLGSIPLSAREQAFVLKAAETALYRETGKSFNDIIKSDKKPKKDKANIERE